MKEMRIIALAAVLFMPAFCLAKGPKDPLTVAPDMYKLLFENDKVRVMEVTFKPGQKIAEHSHPDHFVFVKEPGKLKISKPDGTSSDADLKSEQVIWIPSESHWAENTGSTTVQLVV
ncbi:MAG: hypothetical protein DCC75_12555, partial [Proteobacteria bacterium]